MFEINYLINRLSGQKVFVRTLNGLMFALLALSIAQWGNYYMNQRYKALLVGTQSSTPPSSLVGYNADELIANHIFGTPKSHPDTPIQTNIPLSSLNLKLTGVITSDRGGFALISVNGQPQSPFYIGEVVTGNALLDAVLPDRVILLRGGIKESLLLNTDQDAIPMAPANSKPHPASSTIPDHFIKKVSDNRFQVSRNFISNNVNNTDLLRQALIVPNPGGGFIVKNIQSGSVVEKLGLRTGDIINKVNNLKINSMVDVMQLYYLTGDINKLKNVKVEVTRNANRQTLLYSLH